MARLNQKVTTFDNDTGIDPWVGAGHIVAKGSQKKGAMVLREASMDFEVVKEPLVHHGRKVEGYNAILRKDTGKPLGVVGDRYTAIQPTAAVEVLDPIVESGKAVYEVAGVLDEGRLCWVMLRYKEEIELPGHDHVVRYLLFVNSYDGSKALRIFPTPKRAACANIIAAQIAGYGAEGLSVRHTSTAEQRIKEAARIVTLSDSYYREFGAQAFQMARTKIRDEQVEKMLAHLFPSKEEGETTTRMQGLRDKVMELYAYGAEHSKIAGTAWAALNAVTEFADHHRGTRVLAGRDEKESRLASSLFGTGSLLKRKAYEYVQSNMMLKAA